jgi:hypothetical protein
LTIPSAWIVNATSLATTSEPPGVVAPKFKPKSRRSIVDVAV